MFIVYVLYFIFYILYFVFIFILVYSIFGVYERTADAQFSVLVKKTPWHATMRGWSKSSMICVRVQGLIWVRV